MTTTTMTVAERMHKLFADDWDYTMGEHPEFATYAGVPGHNHRWTDYSLAAEERRKEHDRKVLAEMQSLDRSQLDDNDQLNYDIYLQRAQLKVESHQFPEELMPITQFMGAHQEIDRILGMMPAFTTKHFEDMVERLRAVPQLIDQVLDLLKKGLAEGITPPQITLRDVPRQIASQIHEDPKDSSLLRAFEKIPDAVPHMLQEQLRREATAAYKDGFLPAFVKLHDYVKDTYLPGCRQTIALADMPNGAAWYDYAVRYFITTEMKVQEIHDIGMAEVYRIRAEMDRVIKKSGFTGSFEQFIDFLNTDPQFFFKDADSLMVAYRDISKRLDPELVKLFGKLPRCPYGVLPVPPHVEQAAPTAYYEGGSIEGGRPGYFYANTYNLEARPRWEMEPLTVHEAVPGHHLQVALAQEMEDVPEFRKHINFTAYIEGWGLYSESLGEELGMYTDPYSKFGQLSYEMWRACRLVVDTGMHALGWTRQKAIDFMKEQTGKTDHDIVVEIDRYIVWPGQALAYKIGELTLKRLRAQALAELGDHFDIRAFHDEILAYGPLPLDLLETRMGQWTHRRRAAAHKA